MMTSAETQPKNEADMDRIPVSVLTGFLGSGKTTLLNRWVQQPELEGVAVLVNEFGDVGIDHHLVAKTDDSMLLLDSGCLCCSIQGDLVTTFKELSGRMARGEIPPITRVLIETTGLADPVPVLYTLMEEPFVCARFVCDAVITAISATQGEAQLQKHVESRRQITVADRILITQCDLASTAEVTGLQTAIQALNPQAPVVQVRHGIADVNVLFGAGLYGKRDFSTNLQDWLGAEIAHQKENGNHKAKSSETGVDAHEHTSGKQHERHLGQGTTRSLLGSRHSDKMSSFTICFDGEIPWFGFSLAMGHILREYGDKLLRVKGILSVYGNARPHVVQCVHDVAYPPLCLPQWPSDGTFQDKQGRLVFISRELDDAAQQDIRARLAKLPADAAALRELAADINMPTRCWMQQHVPVWNEADPQHDGWIVQAKRLKEPV